MSLQRYLDVYKKPLSYFDLNAISKLAEVTEDKKSKRKLKKEMNEATIMKEAKAKQTKKEIIKTMNRKKEEKKMAKDKGKKRSIKMSKGRNKQKLGALA
jgi:hypothetical protein